MCGRYVLAVAIDELAAYLDAAIAPGVAELYRPSYNIAPTTDVLGLVEGRDGGRRLEIFRWGLVPSWAKDVSIGSRAFNARSETVASKPMFRAAYRTRRVAIIGEGYYEWDRHRAVAQPYFITSKGGAPMCFAGLWERWGGADQELRSAAIVTTPAGADTAMIHDRVPVVIEPDALSVWLDRDEQDPEVLDPLLRPLAPSTLVARPVSRRVGNVREDDPQLIDEVAPEPVAHADAEAATLFDI